MTLQISLLSLDVGTIFKFTFHASWSHVTIGMHPTEGKLSVTYRAPLGWMADTRREWKVDGKHVHVCDIEPLWLLAESWLVERILVCFISTRVQVLLDVIREFLFIVIGHLPWSLLLKYQIEVVAVELPYVGFTFPARIFYRGVSGFATGYSYGIWCRELA